MYNLVISPSRTDVITSNRQLRLCTDREHDLIIRVAVVLKYSGDVFYLDEFKVES